MAPKECFSCSGRLRRGRCAESACGGNHRFVALLPGELDQHAVAGVAVAAREDPGEARVGGVEDAESTLFELVVEEGALARLGCWDRRRRHSSTGPPRGVGTPPRTSTAPGRRVPARVCPIVPGSAVP